MPKTSKISYKADAFHPRFPLKNAHIQSILSSLRIRAIGAHEWTSGSLEEIFTSSNGGRLEGLYTSQRSNRSKGLVIFLHGWEGSVESTYILTTGRYLFANGYDVFRLNYRDHGQSHHLNTGLFFATNLVEVFESVRQAATLSNGGPVFLAGFSLGGNFALRISRECAAFPIPNLRHVVAISPVLDPSRATDCIDQAPLYREYFLKKWRRSLRIKQQLFPELYNFEGALRSRSCREMTKALLPHQSEFSTPAEYFHGYSLTGKDFKNTAIPMTIITAADDPIIPVDDFERLHLASQTRLMIHRHGGHNGFIMGLFSGTWYERFMAAVFDAIRKQSGVFHALADGNTVKPEDVIGITKDGTSTREARHCPCVSGNNRGASDGI
jgi:uncharacterized protein